MEPPPYHERLAIYRQVIEPFVERLRAGTQTVHVPRLIGLRRREPGSFFHATPELFLQHDGATDFACPGDRFALRAGEIAVVPRWVPHAERSRHLRGSPFGSLVVVFNPRELAFLKSVAGDDGRPSVIYADAFTEPRSEQLARYLDDIGTGRESGPELARALLLAHTTVLLEILRRAEAGQPPLEQGHPKVRRAQEMIRVDLSDPGLTVSRLARDLRCTPDYLTRLFREETGLSLNATIRKERLAHARALLEDPSVNISEAAWASGFRSPNYFIRVFRHATGAAPGKTRIRLGLGTVQPPRPSPMARTLLGHDQ